MTVLRTPPIFLRHVAECPIISQSALESTRPQNAEGVGQRLNQDAWDQVRRLMKNLL